MHVFRIMEDPSSICEHTHVLCSVRCKGEGFISAMVFNEHAKIMHLVELLLLLLLLLLEFVIQNVLWVLLMKNS
jgi:hypothetical protein